jgi:capsular exopolysaccharide synthesis family protein
MSDNLTGNIVTQTTNFNKSELFSLSLRDLFYKYVRFLPMFVLAVAFALFVAYVYLRYATKYYNIAGTMHIKSEPQGGGRTDKYDDIFLNAKTLNLSSEIEVLKSRPLMERVVSKKNLNVDYFAIGKIKTANIYKQCPFQVVFFEIKDSAVSFSLKIEFDNNQNFTVNGGPAKFKFNQVLRDKHADYMLIRDPAAALGKEYSIVWHPVSSAAAGFASLLQVTPKSLGTGILNISILTTSPHLGVDIVNGAAVEYDSVTIEEKNIQADRALKFINEQLDTLKKQLQLIQGELLDFKKKNGIINVETQSGDYFSRITESDKQIFSLMTKKNAADFISNYLSKTENEFELFNLVPSSLGLDDATLNELVRTYNTTQLERKNLIEAKVARENPTIKQREKEIGELRNSLIENLKSIKRLNEIEMDALKKQYGFSEGQLKLIPEKEQQLNEIQREVAVKQELHNIMLKKKQETEIQRASQISNSKIVNKATLTNTPVKPNRRAIQILAILLGLGLPAMFVFIREVLDDKISTRFDIEKITPAPILGEVGHSYSENALVVTKTTRKMVAEQFRIIRSNLQYILGKNEKSVILVSSSFSGEGKSFISTNLAAVMSLAGKKTIVLEFDIRKPKILSGLNMAKKPGITNYLVGKANIEELPIKIDQYENLYVLPCGPIPPNPAELLLEGKVEEMFKWLKNNFDVVVVDTAPVGMVSDAQTLGKFADCTLYIVRQGHTFKKQVALIDEFYQQQKLPRVSIIINDVKVKPGYGYYGYGRYGYGYGYGTNYGYYEDETPRGSILDKVFGLFNFRRLFKK